MTKLKVYVNYNEFNNSFKYRNFTIVNDDIEVGDFYNHEEIKTIEDITPDLRSMSLLDDYRLVRITTTFNGDYDIDNDDYCEEYLAIEK